MNLLTVPFFSVSFSSFAVHISSSGLSSFYPLYLNARDQISHSHIVGC